MTLFKNERGSQGPIAQGVGQEGFAPFHTTDVLCATRSETVLAAQAEAYLEDWRNGTGDEVMAARQQAIAVATEVAQHAQPVAHVIYGVSF